MSNEKALTLLDVQIAESRLNFAWNCATFVAVLLALIPGFPAISAAIVPSALVGCMHVVVSLRRLRAAKRARART